MHLVIQAKWIESMGMETGADAPKIGLYFVNARENPSCFSQTEQAVKELENIELDLKISLEDVLYQIKSGKKCVIIFTITDRTDLSAVVNGLFSITREIKERKVLAVVFMKFSSDKVEELLMRSGVTEILKFDVSAKAFSHKLNRHIKIVEQEEASDGIISLAGEKKDSAKKDQVLGHDGAQSDRGFQIEMTPDWSGENDFWLFRKKNHAKKYQTNWLIEMIGPSPAAGHWEVAGASLWQWKTRQEDSFFDLDPHSWQFSGNEPIYSWVINRWAFVGENPSLSFIEAGECVYSRFSLKNSDTILIAHNSEYAKKAFPKIKDTYDQTYVITAEKKDIGILDGLFGQATEIPWADKTDSKGLSVADWNVKHQDPEIDREWNDQETLDFLTGAEAMRECGLKGEIKNYFVDLLEYSEARSTVVIGLDSALVEYKEVVDLTVFIELMNLPDNLKLRGIVTSIGEVDDFGKTVVVILMLEKSKLDFRKIREAVEQRQREVISFLHQAKGSG